MLIDQVKQGITHNWLFCSMKIIHAAPQPDAKWIFLQNSTFQTVLTKFASTDQFLPSYILQNKKRVIDKHTYQVVTVKYVKSLQKADDGCICTFKRSIYTLVIQYTKFYRYYSNWNCCQICACSRNTTPSRFKNSNILHLDMN